MVGHTPKSDHFIYDIVMDFAGSSERLAAKVYRGGKNANSARNLAQKERANLEKVYAAFQRKKLTGIPRPLGDFAAHCAVVTEKISGLPLQSIIMKAALLPGYATNDLFDAARQAGEWLRNFHKATADSTIAFDSTSLLKELESVCVSCKKSGLDDDAIAQILTGAKAVLSKVKKSLGASAVLNDFSPLNVVISEDGVGFCDYAKMEERGVALDDVAMFLACVESLEKYPFCDRRITTRVQHEFADAYCLTPSEQAIVRVLKMKYLLGMFAQGRNVKETAMRKKIMWANVMKKFIHEAAQRSLAA